MSKQAGRHMPVSISLKPVLSEIDPEILPFVKASTEFLLRHKWCQSTSITHYAVCVPGVFFLGKATVEGDDEWFDREVWVIVGDVPPIYLAFDLAPTPMEALNSYIAELEFWIEQVRCNGDFSEAIPIEAPRTEEYASMLEERVMLLDKYFCSHSD